MTPVKLKETIKKLPHRPGIYIFKNAKNKPLYIGKSSDLKNRVKYYLKTSDFRLQKMIAAAKKMDYVQTDSDVEALILESQYIKKCQPMFNIMLRDDKQYFYVGFTEEEFPKIFLTHQPIKKQPRDKKQGTSKNKKSTWSLGHLSLVACYIGPFTDGNALKITLNYLRKIFPYCTCKQLHNNFCLNYHIGKCPGICCLKNPTTYPFDKLRVLSLSKDNLQPKTYGKNIRAIKEILSGKKRSLVKDLEKEIKKLAKEGKLEGAIELRSKLEKLERVFENAHIVKDFWFKNYDLRIRQKGEMALRQLAKIAGLGKSPHRIEAYDIANIQGKYAVGVMVAFVNGKPDKNEYRKFKIRTKESPDDTAMIKEVLIRRFNHPEWKFPDLILVDGGKAQLSASLKAIYNFKSLISKKVPVIAMAKNEKHRGEKIYVLGRKSPIPLSQLPVSVKNLLLHIDSEAHRFAISYYRKVHRKKALWPL